MQLVFCFWVQIQLLRMVTIDEVAGYQRMLDHNRYADESNAKHQEAIDRLMAEQVICLLCIKFHFDRYGD
ncbi:MAG: hypothetical protein LBR73_07030 [Oscillospiraceae bacterium]|nr:hypothetical protein [Oscillospiraceae bacterium]